MKSLRKKINSQNGASVLLALMLFLVCFMVSAVILSAATANVDKMRQRESMQREYLAVSSAAQLLQEIIGGVAYDGWETNTVYQCFGELASIRPAKHTDKAEICTEMAYDAGVEARLREQVAALVYAAFTAHTQYLPPAAVAENLTREAVISGEGMEDVQVKMSLNTNTYTLTCVLTLKDRTDDDNAMTVTFKASVNAPDQSLAEEVVHANADTDHEVLTQVEDDYGMHWVWIPQSYDITVYTIRTKVTYDAGTVSKGVFP